MNKKLSEKIDKFISDKRKTDGSRFSPVEENDLFGLRDIIEMIVRAKWEQDCDGDVPVEWRLVDRTKYLPEFWSLIPYYHELETDEQYREAIRRAMENLDSAAQVLKTLLNHISEYTTITIQEKYKEE